MNDKDVIMVADEKVVTIHFPEKPPDAILQMLKQHSFRQKRDRFHWIWRQRFTSDSLHGGEAIMQALGFCADDTRRLESDDFLQQAVDQAKKERERIMKVIKETGATPPPKDTAEKLHEQLTLAYAALHQIASLACLTRPDEAAEEVAGFGYRRPCKAPECGPCVAFRALIVEGRLPFSS
jgi:hypothetical protein